MKRVTGIALLLIVGFAVWAGAASSAPPPAPTTLHFEVFRDSVPDVTGVCDPKGISVLSYRTFGAATGPYPGVFEETGTVLIGPPSSSMFAFGPLVSVEADFTIDSAFAFVRGHKTLIGSGTGICREFVDHPLFGTGRQFNATTGWNALAYYAEIQLPDGRLFSDEGTASLTLNELQATRMTIDDFGEVFISPRGR